MLFRRFSVVIYGILLMAGCSRGPLPNHAASKGLAQPRNADDREGLGAEGEEAMKLVRRASEAVTSQTMDFGAYMKETCSAIAKCGDRNLRARLYGEFARMAVRADFTKLEAGLPSSSRPIAFEERDAGIRLSNAHCAMTKIVDEAWTRLYLDDASGVEQFTPWFGLIEKLKCESRRLGRTDSALFEAQVEHVERLYNLFYVHDRRHVPQPEARAKIEEGFRLTVGRPIRNWEQYMSELAQRGVKLQAEVERRKSDVGAARTGHAELLTPGGGKREAATLWNEKFKLH